MHAPTVGVGGVNASAATVTRSEQRGAIVVRARHVIAVAALALSLVACGDKGSDGSTPGSSQSAPEKLAKLLEEGGMSKEQASCIGDALQDADLSTAELRDLAKGDTSDFDPKSMQLYVKAVSTCFQTTTTKPG